HHICDGKADENISSLECFRQCFHGLRGREFGLRWIKVCTIVEYTAVTSKHDDVLTMGSQCDVHTGAGNGCRARAVDHYLDFVDFLFLKGKGIKQCCARNDRRTVLIIMHNGDAQFFFQPAFNLETFGCLNVFEVNTAESRLQTLYNSDKLIHVFRIQLNIENVYISEYFEEKPF